MNKRQKFEDKSLPNSYTEGQFFENQTTDNERLLTKKEIAVFLNVSVKMIDKKVFMNEIPYLKVGKLVRFSKQRVLAWAEETTPRR
jgi:excisionase family DNA binding protein